MRSVVRTPSVHARRSPVRRAHAALAKPDRRLRPRHDGREPGADHREAGFRTRLRGNAVGRYRRAQRRTIRVNAIRVALPNPTVQLLAASLGEARAPRGIPPARWVNPPVPGFGNRGPVNGHNGLRARPSTAQSMRLVPQSMTTPPIMSNREKRSVFCSTPKARGTET